MALVSVDCREDQHEACRRVVHEFDGMLIERVRIDCGSVDFSIACNREYLAFHQLQLIDGETKLDGARPQRLLDMRNRFTFAPRGAGICGWSHFVPTSQSFIALSFDSSKVIGGDDSESRLADARPTLYFREANLRQTMLKIERLMQEPATDLLYLESLMVVAVRELSREINIHSVDRRPVMGARLSARHVSLVREYVASNLHRRITLNELSQIVGLSRFHFARSFSRTVGLPPHKYVISKRIELSKTLLQDRRLTIKDVARIAGFANPAEFTRTFVSSVNERPRDFRRRKGWGV